MTKPAKLYGRVFPAAVAPCSCCGLAPESTEGRFATYRAGLVDRDGVYFSYLCGEPDADGAGGCLEDIAAEALANPGARQAIADELRDLAGDDEDSIATDMADIGGGLWPGAE